MSEIRLICVILLTLVFLYVKWGICVLGTKLCPKVFGIRIESFNVRRQFLLQGWDLSATAVMIILAGVVEPNTRLRLMNILAGQLTGFYAIICLIAFVFCLAMAVFVRYGIQESLRRRRCSLLHSYLWGLAGWTLGAFSLLPTAYLAVRLR